MWNPRQKHLDGDCQILIGDLLSPTTEVAPLPPLPMMMPRSSPSGAKYVREQSPEHGAGVVETARPSSTPAPQQETCYLSSMEKFTAEVIPVNSRVLVDRNAVTSQGPGTTIDLILLWWSGYMAKRRWRRLLGLWYFVTRYFNIQEWLDRRSIYWYGFERKNGVHLPALLIGRQPDAATEFATLLHVNTDK